MPRTFNEQCYELLMQIPKGKVVTYGDIAHALGTKAYQAVGNAMGANPNPIIVPCHRVVKGNGEVGNYALGLDKKIELLHNEGVIIQENKVMDFKTVRFKFLLR
ncbi:MGMT family protein [Psychromonas sp. PT13]|uniref:MGMT family protein n=1 Tax=Psychromonas sp. PT13 TaxID=3439547 RepID=UPI003EBD8569